MSWKDDRPGGCKCPTSRRANPDCPVHGVRTRGRVPAGAEDITEAVGAAMHEALSEVLSREHVKKESWEKAVYAVQREAEIQFYRLMGITVTRKSSVQRLVRSR
jgi:hypothetical protein